MSTQSPKARLDRFLAKYTPAVAAFAKKSIAVMDRRLPGAVRLVYDNYNALVIGYGPTARPSEAVLSLAVMPRWVSLCFIQSASTLPDPDKLLRGEGKMARHIRLESARDLEKPAVRALIAAALARSPKPIDPKGRGPLIIKSISAKQRPRRPAQE